MSTPPPCIGTEFEIKQVAGPSGHGINQLQTKGPRQAAWPYAQSQAANNGLSRDPGGGLWADVLGLATSIGGRTTQAVSTVCPELVYTLSPTLTISWDNQLCEAVQLIISTHFRAAGTFALGGQASMRCYQGLSLTPDPTGLQRYAQEWSPNVATPPPFLMAGHIISRFRVEPLTTITVNRQMAIFAGPRWTSPGTVTVTSWEVESFGFLMPNANASN